MSSFRLTEEQFAALSSKRRAANVSTAAAAAPKKRRQSKFHNERIETEDGVFDSKREAGRFADLKLLAKGRAITAISRQVRFDLNEGGTYVADFVYLDRQSGKWVVEDRKGFRTPVYIRKRKLMLELYGIDILET